MFAGDADKCIAVLYLCEIVLFFFFVLLYFVCIICAERERGRNERKKILLGEEKNQKKIKTSYKSEFEKNILRSGESK